MRYGKDGIVLDFVGLPWMCHAREVARQTYYGDHHERVQEMDKKGDLPV